MRLSVERIEAFIRASADWIERAKAQADAARAAFGQTLLLEDGGFVLFRGAKARLCWGKSTRAVLNFPEGREIWLKARDGLQAEKELHALLKREARSVIDRAYALQIYCGDHLRAALAHPGPAGIQGTENSAVTAVLHPHGPAGGENVHCHIAGDGAPVGDIDLTHDSVISVQSKTYSLQSVGKTVVYVSTCFCRIYSRVTVNYSHRCQPQPGGVRHPALKSTRARFRQMTGDCGQCQHRCRDYS